MSKLNFLVIAFVMSLLVSNPVLAQIDVTSVTASLADGQAGIAFIGTGMIGFVAAGMGFKWLLGFII